MDPLLGPFHPEFSLQSYKHIPPWNKPVPGSASRDTSLHPAP